jgi:hypothetical protein
LVWIQPASYKEFSLYKTEAEIALEQPSILPMVDAKYSGSGNKIRVEVTGMTVFPPRTGLSDEKVKITMSEPVLRDAGGEVNGYTVTSHPQIVGGDAENGYIIEFELSKNSGSNVKSAEGTITIPVTVTAKHPTNGKTSRSEEEIYLNINYTPSAGVKAPPRGGRGSQPPPPKAPPKRR